MKSKRNRISETKETGESSVKFHKTILDNGLTILSEEIPSVESFSLGIGVNAGSRDDSIDMPGIAHFLEHAVYRRTKTRTTRKIANLFDSMGAYSNAYTTKEMTLFYVRATKKHFAKTFELLSDIIINPVFKKPEISKERQIIIEEIKSYDDDPEEYVFDLADSVLFPNHQLGNSIDGTIDSLRRIDCDVLSEFHDLYYNPSNIVVALAGNIKHEVLVEEAKLHFDKLAPRKTMLNRTIATHIPSNAVESKPIQQAHLILGKHISSANDKYRFAIALLNIIFGDGLSSRIYQTLREKQGLAYTVFSNLNLYSDIGSLQLYVATDKNSLDKSSELLLGELDKLNKKLITKSELIRAKEQLKTSKILEFESMSARMQSLVKNQILLGDYETLNHSINSIDQVSLDDIAFLIEKYYNCSQWSSIRLIPE